MSTALIDEFMPLAGDRAFAEDAAMIGGWADSAGAASWCSGTEKGADTESG